MSAWFAVLVAIFAFLLIAWPAAAGAQALAVSKQLCSSSGCTPTASNSVAPGEAVWYEITITNLDPSNSKSVNLVDTPPAGLVLVNSDCGQTAASATARAWSGGPGILGNLPVAAGGQYVCLLHGYFDGTTGGGVNSVTVTDEAGQRAQDSVNTLVPANRPLPTDLAITKTANPATLDITYGPQIVTYKIEIANVGQSDVYLGPFLKIQDRLALKPTSVVLDAQLLGATCAVVPAAGSILSDCLNPVATQPASALPRLRIASVAYEDFAAWTYAPNNPGLLRVGHKIVLTVQVRVSPVPGAECIITPGGDGFLEEATIRLTLPGTPTTLPELPAGSSAANNSASIPLQVITGATAVNSACNAPFLPPSPVIQITKAQVLPLPVNNPVAWPGTITYLITVKNISPTLWLRKIRVGDFVREPVGTPPFTARYISHSCLPPVCFPWAQSTQTLAGYGDSKQVWRATLHDTGSGLAPGGSVTVRLRLRYEHPRCDSYTGAGFEPVDNIGIIFGWDQFDPSNNSTVSVAQLQGVRATTRMRTVPRCPLVVRKKPTVAPVNFPPPTVYFNQPYGYLVEYSNPVSTNQTFQVGTLIDALRYVPSPATAALYANQLKVDYNYACTPSGGLSGGYPTSGANTVFIVASALAQQGVRILQNSAPVAFPPGAKLSCLINATVRQPPAADPNCSSAELQNVGILDMSIYYNPNMFTSPSGGPNMMSAVRTPLLKCHNYVINKAAVETWVGQGAAPLHWTLGITNAGPDVTAGTTKIADLFQPAPTALSATTPACQAPATPCGWLWQPGPPSANPILVPTSFKSGQTMTVGFTVPNTTAAPAPLGNNCNSASASFLLPNTPWFGYWKPGSLLTTTSKCILVLKVGKILVDKLVVNTTGIAVAGAYSIRVACTYPNIAIPQSTFSLAAGASFTVSNIPAGSQCTVTESPVPETPPGTRSCTSPYWTTTYVNAQSFTTPSDGASVKMAVVNTLRCSPVGRLVIDKNTIARGPQTPFTFLVDCTPSGPTGLLVTVPANGQGYVADIPSPATCTIVEQPHPAPAGCTWGPVQSPPGAIPIPAGGSATVGVTNWLRCRAAGGDGTLHVRKFVMVNGSKVPASPSTLPPAWQTSFPITISCGGGAPIAGSLNAGNNYQTAAAIPAGVACTVQETTPIFPVQACHWSTTYPQGQTATLPTLGAAATIDVYNEQVCN
ncbi:MAG TPA: DUF5979 domain-containing protein [Allosphingosinicella sp.]|jgi:uncharacterized repeat protein (TIGR01451 family)